MKVRKSPLGFKLKGAVILMMAVSGGMFSQLTLANTSAGTVLRNTVTVDYKDVNNVAQTQKTASVDVTVDLVPSVVWGTKPADQTVQSAQALPSAYLITLTNGGNGSDSYTITDSTTQSCTTGTLGAQSFGFTTPVVLGATVSSGAGVFATNTTIPVSNIVAADFIAGDKVKIGANIYTVVSASSDGIATTPDSLVVAGNATADVAAAGVQIGEQISYSYGGSGTAGALSAGATGCEHAHTLKADGTLATGGNTQTTASVNGWKTIVQGVQLSVVKYVRNVTTSAKNSGAVAVTYSGVNYYLTGVSGNPGDTMEYLVVITNASAGTANNVVFNDTLPNFTTYQTSTIAVDTNGDQTFNIVLPTNETEAVGTGIVTQAGQNIKVFPGIGGNEGTNTGGAVTNLASAPANKTAVKYRIKID